MHLMNSRVLTMMPIMALLLSIIIPACSMRKPLPPVQPSEYASMGKISQYVGHINDLAGLKAALAACSYKNEVIFVSTTSVFVDAAAQTIDMFRYHGGYLMTF